MTLSLELLLTDRQGFGLATASPCQRAICRALDGESIDHLATDDNVWEAFGRALPPPVMPHEAVILAGIRSGKSLIAACAGVRSALSCDVSKLGPGEIPRVSIVSLSRDLARVTFGHLYGRVANSAALRPHLLGDPTGETLTLRHPSGRPVEVAVVAGSRAGSSLVARWCAGVIFDEAPRMVGTADGVINLTDARAAVLERLLPGAQALYIGSPWAPMGPVYEWVSEYFGHPTADMLVVKARGPWMNPEHWTAARCEQARERDPLVHRTDVLGEFADAEQTFFPSAAIEASTRPELLHVPPEDDAAYSAAIDPATRGNAWTLVILGCREPGRYFVAYHRQWQGSPTAPLRPEEVIAEIATECERYSVPFTYSDQFAADYLSDLAGRYGLGLIPVTFTGRKLMDMLDRVKMLLTSGALELPPDTAFSRDLVGTVKRLTATDAKVVLPRTRDGRHGDYVPPLAILCSEPLDCPITPRKRRSRPRFSADDSPQMEYEQIAARLGRA